MKVLVATEKPFAKVAIDGIKAVTDKAGYELVLLEKYTEKKQLLDAVADADAVIIRSDIVDAEVIAAGKNLKIVVRAGAGYDNVDLEAATKAGVCVMNTLEPLLTGVYVPVEVKPVIIFSELVVYEEVVLFLSFISVPY